MQQADERAAMDTIPLLQRALTYEDSLRSRTEGLTWTVWGVVLGLVFFMYASMGALGHDMPPWLGFLWVGWVLVGSAITWALWRTAALSLGGTTRRPAGLAVTLAWIGAILAAFAVMAFAPGAPNPDGAPLVAVGAAWTFMGGANLFRATPTGRRAALAIGLVTLAAGIAIGLLLPPPEWNAPTADAQRFAQDVLRGGIAALVPVAVGLWQALRG